MQDLEELRIREGEEWNWGGGITKNWYVYSFYINLFILFNCYIFYRVSFFQRFIIDDDEICEMYV